MIQNHTCEQTLPGVWTLPGPPHILIQNAKQALDPTDYMLCILNHDPSGKQASPWTDCQGW